MDKERILEVLKSHLEAKGLAQADVAKSIGYSPAMVTQALKGAHEKISEEFWLKLAAYLGIRSEWQLAPIHNYSIVTGACVYAQSMSRAKCICFEPGMGKSAPLRHYARTTANAFYVECEEHWRGKDFIRAVSKSLAIKSDGTRSEMIETIINFLKGKKTPLLIIDEFDKLTDCDLQLFKTFYNKLEDVCGFLLCGAPFLRRRIETGVRKDKQGYKEIYSRFGGEFISLRKIVDKDITAICSANGITDKSAIAEIMSKYKGDGVGKYGDLRTLKEVIMKHIANNG